MARGRRWLPAPATYAQFAGPWRRAVRPGRWSPDPYESQKTRKRSSCLAANGYSGTKVHAARATSNSRRRGASRSDLQSADGAVRLHDQDGPEAARFDNVGATRRLEAIAPLTAAR